MSGGLMYNDVYNDEDHDGGKDQKHEDEKREQR